jgi:superfamily II DNA or RNA helicase
MELSFDKGTLKLSGWSGGAKLPFFRWDPRVNYFRAPAFRYREVKKYLTRKSYPLVDRVGTWKKVPITAGPPSLRYYQQAALDHWKTAAARGVITLPTGSGKTQIAIAALVWLSTPTLILVPTLVLLEQWQELLSKALGFPIGVIGDGNHDRRPITVTTFESAHRHMANIGHLFQLLVVDEVHHFGGGLRDELLEMTAAPFRMGLTATPPEGENATKISAWVGPTVYSLTVADLTGIYLAPFDHFPLQVELSMEERIIYETEMSTFRRYFRLWAEASGTNDWKLFIRSATKTEEGKAAIRSWRRARAISQFPEAKKNQLALLLQQYRGRKTLIFTVDTPAAYQIARSNLVAPITNDIKRRERSAVLERFSKGEITSLVSCRVLNEGYDLPDAEVAIITGGAFGEREHVQRIGRCLRPREGKRAIIYELISANTMEVGQSFRRGKSLDTRSTFEGYHSGQPHPSTLS